MKARTAMLVALAITLMMVSAALAQDEDTYEVTFQLTIYGEAPTGESFRVQGARLGAHKLTPGGLFCGREDADKGYIIGPRCNGGGAMYATRPSAFASGERVQFNFDWLGVDGTLTTFFEDIREATQNITISAYYDFRTGQGGAGNGVQQPGMPNTGGGGTVAGEVPAGTTLAALACLAACSALGYWTYSHNS